MSVLAGENSRCMALEAEAFLVSLRDGKEASAWSKVRKKGSVGDGVVGILSCRLLVVMTLTCHGKPQVGTECKCDTG